VKNKETKVMSTIALQVSTHSRQWNRVSRYCMNVSVAMVDVSPLTGPATLESTSTW